MNDQAAVERVHQAIADHDALYPRWRHGAREREEREAEERARKERRTQRRAEEQAAKSGSDAWCSWIESRIEAALANQGFNELQRDTLGALIASERADRAKEINAAVEEAKRAFEAKLAEMEARLKAVPGQLPVAKTWTPKSVTYQAQLVCHEGALWQAKKDTAQAPGDVDWLCVARAGRDGQTPNVKGTFDASANYARLDIVTLNGGSFIALRENPGSCPGDDWRLLTRQGARGVAGEKGERGLRGEKGERGESPPAIISWHIDRATFRAIPFLSSGDTGPALELRGLFEQYQNETS